MKRLFPVLAVLIASCAKDRTPEPATTGTPSDTLVHYDPVVKHFIDVHCIQCHDNTTGIPLNDYSHVKAFALAGDLTGSITGNPNYTKMPPGEIVPEGEIQQVVEWVNDGCPE